MPVYYKTLIGGLSAYPEVIHFEPSFPFATSEVVLSVSNQYQQPVSVKLIKPLPPDTRFYVSPAAAGGGEEEEEDGSRYPQLGPNHQTEVCVCVWLYV